MKRYILLILFLLASFRGFSQIDTVAVKLNDPLARAVIKDLIIGDACQQEKKQIEQTLMLTEKKVSVQSRIIDNLEQQQNKDQEIIILKDEQLDSKDNIIKSREKELKRNKVRNVFTIISAAVGGFLIGSLIK